MYGYIAAIINYTLSLLTKSEVISGKSQVETLLYWPSYSGVNTARPRFEIFLLRLNIQGYKYDSFFPPFFQALNQPMFITNYLITESVVVTGKSQTEVSPYWTSESKVNTVGRGLRFSHNDRTVKVINLKLFFFNIWHTKTKQKSQS